MVRIGLVGIGFMGRIHALAWAGVPGARLVAIQSRDERKRQGDWSTTRGNFGPTPGPFDLTGITAYESFADLLADPNVDLVDICTPTDQHPEQAIRALEAGKHVLVEKPIALTVADADRMLAASVAAGRQLMVAHVLPFIFEFAFVADAVTSQRYGQLIAAQFLRVISRPDWSAEIADAARTGGPAIDLHIHDTHFINLLAGMPDRVSATGIVADGAVNYLATNYHYGPGTPALSCVSGAVAAPGRPFAHGFEIFLENATITYHSGGVPLTIAHHDGTSATVELPTGSDELAGFRAELAAATSAITSGTVPRELSPVLARNALELCQAEIESVCNGHSVKVGEPRNLMPSREKL